MSTLVVEDFNTVLTMADLLAKTFVVATGTIISSGGPDTTPYHDVTKLTNEDIAFVAFSSVGFWVLPNIPVTSSDRAVERELLTINDGGDTDATAHMIVKITTGGSLVVYGRSTKLIGFTDRNINLIDGVWAHVTLQTFHDTKGFFTLYVNENPVVSATNIATRVGATPTSLTITVQANGIDDLRIETDTAMPPLPVISHPAPTARVTRMGIEVLSTLSASAAAPEEEVVVTPVGIPTSESIGAHRVTTPASAIITRISTSLFGSLAVLPIEASVPAKETLAWKTDTQVSHDGTEVTIKLREAPRQELTYRLSEGIQRLAEAILTEWGAIGLDWVIPIWTEVQDVGVISLGAGTISVPTDDFAYSDKSLALIYENALLWEVVEIDTITSSVLTLLFATVNAYTAARVLPCRVGLVKASIDKNHTGFSAITSITYRVTDNTVLAESVPSQYQGEDVYFEDGLLPDTGTPFRQTVSTRTLEADFEVGLFDKTAPWIYNRISSEARTVIQGFADIRLFKRFLERRSGKFRAFWQPTFIADLKVLSVGTITTILSVEAIGQGNWSSKRLHIAVLDTSGTWHLREVTSFTLVSTTTMDLGLDTALNLESTDISLVSYLVRSRLVEDSVTITWIGNCALEAKIKVIEVSI